MTRTFKYQSQILRNGSFSFAQPFHPCEQGAFQQRGLGHLFSKVQQTLQDCQPDSFNNADNFPNNMSFVGDRNWCKEIAQKI